MGVAGGCQVKDTEEGVTDVNWRLVGACTTGLAMKKHVTLSGWFCALCRVTNVCYALACNFRPTDFFQPMLKQRDQTQVGGVPV